MEEKSYPDVASFLIRFVQDHSKPEGIAGYRGVIRHIQTDLEQAFTCWEDVETFIQQVVPLELMQNNQKE